MRGEIYLQKVNRIIAIFLIIIVIFLYVSSLSGTNEAMLLPRLLLILIMILSVLLLISGGEKVKQKNSQNEKTSEKILLPRLILTIVITIIYILFLKILGFYLSTFAYLLFIFISTGFKQKWLAVSITLGFMGFLYLIFSLWLKVPLPECVFF